MIEHELTQAAMRFQATLQETKRSIDPAFPWYPYGTLNNFHHLEPLFRDGSLLNYLRGGRIADIGAADGDTAFFLEPHAQQFDIIDYGPTNFNTLRGARLLKEKTGSGVQIHELNLDSYFDLPSQEYQFIFFLGILYHLKNPFYVLEKLSYATRYMVVSTRIARFAPDGTDIRNLSVAYLVGETELNNDATNFWILTEGSLATLLRRTGWDVVSQRTVGDTVNSSTSDNARDERYFALLRSRR